MKPDSLLALAGGLSAGLAAVAAWAWFRPRPTPEERERQRRAEVSRTGRMIDATCTDVRDDGIYYSYSVAGVYYMASQNVAGLESFLPEDPSFLIGQPVTAKYTQQNPANSIVVCEEWSGLRLHGRAKQSSKEEGDQV